MASSDDGGRSSSYSSPEVDYVNGVLDPEVAEFYKPTRLVTGLCAADLVPLLRERLALLAGGRDRRGGPIMCFPSWGQVHERQQVAFSDMLLLVRYLSYLPEERVKTLGFTVVVDMRGSTWSFVKPILKVLEEGLVDCVDIVYMIKPDKFLEKQKANLAAGKYSFELRVVSVEGLFREIDPSQLTKEFQGTLPYNNEEWIQLRCRLEDFFTMAHDMSDKLATLYRAIDRRDTPSNLIEAKHRLDEHRSARNKVAHAPVQLLEAEAIRLSQWLRQGCETGPHSGYLGTSWVCMNPDFQSLTPGVAEAIQRLYELRARLADKWESQRAFLEQAYQLRLFEEDAARMCNWLRSQRHLFLTSYNHIGNGAAAASELATEHAAFLQNCTSVCAQVGRLSTAAAKLANAGHFAGDEMTMRASQLDKEWCSLSAALDDRSRVLQLSCTFHRRAEHYFNAARAWQADLGNSLSSRSPRADAEDSAQQLEAALQDLMRLLEEESFAYNEVCFAGKALLTHLQSPPAPGAHSQLLAQIDYSAASHYVMTRIHELLNAHRRLETLAAERRRTSHQRLAAFHFRADCVQVLAWLDEHGDPFLERQTAVGRSLARAEQLYNAHMQFEQVAANTEVNAERLCQAAEEVAATAPDPDSLLADADTLGRRIMRFTTTKKRRREALDLAVGFYQHTREMLDLLADVRSCVSIDVNTPMLGALEECEEMSTTWRQRRESVANCGERLHVEGTALLAIRLEAEDAQHLRSVLSQVAQEEDTTEALAAQHQLRIDLCLQLRLFEADCAVAHSGLAELSTAASTAATDLSVEQLEERTAALSAETTAAEDVLHKGSELAAAFEAIGVTFCTLDGEEAAARVARLITELAAAAAEEDERRISYAAELEWRRCQSEAKQVSQWIHNGESMLAATITSSVSVPATLFDSENARRDHEHFQEALKQMHASAFTVMARLESLREGHPRAADARRLEEELQSRWQRLVGSAEERHKLIAAAVNWFKTAEQVSSVLGGLEKEYRREEDPCGGSTDISAAEVAERLRKHGEQKEAFLKACILARRTADQFLKYLQRASASQPNRANHVVLTVRQALQRLMKAEGALIAAWTTRRRRLDQCHDFLLFRDSAQQILNILEVRGAGSSLDSSVIDHVNLLVVCAEKFAVQRHLHAHDILKLKHLVESRLARDQPQPSAPVSASPIIPPSSSTTPQPSDHKKDEQLRLNRRRDNILHEIINTEKQYLVHLETCLARYRGALRQPPSADLQVPAALRGKEHIIFGNMDEILAFHRDVFIRELERYHESLLPEDVGHCFVTFGENMAALYVAYCVNTPESQKLQEQDVSFFDQIQAALHLAEPLQSYLIKPVQRITKYQLLLKELLDCCEGEGELREGLDTMLAVPKKANDALHLSLLEELPEDAATGMGEILLQEQFTVWEPKQIIKKGRERRVFLFDLGIVFAKSVVFSASGQQQKRYVYRSHVWLAECWITEHVEGDQCKFCIWQGRVPNVVRDEHRVGTMLRADSLDTKQQWVRALRETMQERAFVSTLYRASRSSENSLSALSESATLQENYRDSDSGISLNVGQTVELLECQGEWATVRAGSQGQEVTVPTLILKRQSAATTAATSSGAAAASSVAAVRRGTSFRKWLPNRKKSSAGNTTGISMFKRNSKSELSASVLIGTPAAPLNPPVTDVLDNVSEESVDVELPPPMDELIGLPNFDDNVTVEHCDGMADPGQALVDGVYGDNTSTVNCDNSALYTQDQGGAPNFAEQDTRHFDSYDEDDDDGDDDDDDDDEDDSDEDDDEEEDEDEDEESYCERCEDTDCYCQDCHNPYYNESDANPSDADEVNGGATGDGGGSGKPQSHDCSQTNGDSNADDGASSDNNNGNNGSHGGSGGSGSNGGGGGGGDGGGGDGHGDGNDGDDGDNDDDDDDNGDKKEKNDEVGESVKIRPETQLPPGRRFPPIMELLESERSYVARLEYVQERYLGLSDAEPYPLDTQLPEDLKSKWRIVWGNWSALLDLHKGLLQKMEAAFEADPDSIPRCFVPAERRIRALYCKYCENHRKAVHVAEQHRSYFESVRLEVGDKDVIASHLMQPVQRIMRYQLPLLEIVKGCGKDALAAERTAEWQRMLDAMKEIPKDTECIMEASRIDGFEGNITALGKVRIKGVLKVASVIEGNKEPLKFMDRKIFLFDQMMLVTEEKKMGRAKDQFSDMTGVYTFRNKVKVNNMRFVAHFAAENLNEDPDELRFAIRDTAPRRSASDDTNPNLYVMEPPDPATRTQWVVHLKELEKMQQDFLKQLQNPRQSSAGLLGSSGTHSYSSSDGGGKSNKRGEGSKNLQTSASCKVHSRKKLPSLRLSKIRSKTDQLLPPAPMSGSEKRGSCPYTENNDLVDGVPAPLHSKQPSTWSFRHKSRKFPATTLFGRAAQPSQQGAASSGATHRNCNTEECILATHDATGKPSSTPQPDGVDSEAVAGISKSKKGIFGGFFGTKTKKAKAAAALSNTAGDVQSTVVSSQDCGAKLTKHLSTESSS